MAIYPSTGTGKNVARKRYYIPDNPDGVTPSRLKRLSRAAQHEYMEAWFREYYEDPANETPRLDGEFTYVWGGPYDALDELGNEFSDLVPEDRIQELAKELVREHIDWAPTSRKHEEDMIEVVDDEEDMIEVVDDEADELEVAGTLAASAEQRPAAYRFQLRDGKIDVLPEPPEPVDRAFAFDTYHELVAKARKLHERLKGANSARRVCDSIERLLTALGADFDDLRPGVLLSRERSIAADRIAFGDELFPDAIAMMDDVLGTLHDLLAAFPIVRRIEAEQLALNLDRNADAIPIIQQQMALIETSADRSTAVTQHTIVALTQNDAAIEDATDTVVRTGLTADKLLVFRNFAGAVIGGIASAGRIALTKAGPELAGFGGDIWKEVRARLPKGVGLAVAVAPLFLLADQISDPYLRIGAAVPALTPVASVLKKAIADSVKDALAGKAKDKPKGKGRGKSR